jgi:hypothetical protein
MLVNECRSARAVGSGVDPWAERETLGVLAVLGLVVAFAQFDVGQAC